MFGPLPNVGSDRHPGNEVLPLLPDDWVAELGKVLAEVGQHDLLPGRESVVIDVHSRPMTPTWTATWRVSPPSSTVTRCWLPTVLIADVGTARPEALCSVTMVTVPALPLLTDTFGSVERDGDAVVARVRGRRNR